MTTLAVIAAALAVGAYLGVRAADTWHRHDHDLQTLVLHGHYALSDVRVEALPPAPRTGPAPAELPPAGAGPTLEHPAPAAPTGQSAPPVPGHN